MGSQIAYKTECLRKNLTSKIYNRGKSSKWYKQYCKNYANGFISESDKKLIENL